MLNILGTIEKIVFGAHEYYIDPLKLYLNKLFKYTINNCNNCGAEKKFESRDIIFIIK